MLTKQEILDIFKEKEVMLEGHFLLTSEDIPINICSVRNFSSMQTFPK